MRQSKAAVFLLSFCLINLKIYTVQSQNLDAEVIKKFSTQLHDVAPKRILDGRLLRISLNGYWKYLQTSDEAYHMAYPEYNDKAWQEMLLPSNWYLRGRKEYPGDQGMDYNGTVWFRRAFYLPESWRGKTIRLELDMVDYYSDIFLNGCYVESHEGYFQKFAFPVENKLKYGATNQIAIRVNSPELPYDLEERIPVGWPKRQNMVKGVFGYHDTRPGGTSKRGQERGTGGIIGGVYIAVKDFVTLDRIQMKSDSVSEKKAIVEMRFLIVNHLEATQMVELIGQIQPANFSSSTAFPFSQKVKLVPGENQICIRKILPNPRLWWSWDYGKPNLYQLNCELKQEGAVLNRSALRFGIRSIAVDEKWNHYLNGIKIYPRGSNYISTQWLSQMDKSDYVRDVQLMKDANLNAIRVHAHLEKQAFYEVCDELGIMVFQDFPLQWGYADLKAFHQSALRQYQDMIEQFFNHPSIILWCCHNESPWDANWMQKKNPEQNKALDESLKTLSLKLDPTRPTIINSGTEDLHLYFGWYSDALADFGDIQKLNQKPRTFLVTEYGAQAVPNLETLQKMFTTDALWPDNKGDSLVWAFRNYQDEQTTKIAKVNKGKSIEEFICNSQTYQANYIKYATEMLRRQKGRFNGLYHFMFVENWPSITWAVLDYYRTPKKGYFALQQAMQPVLPSIEYEIDKVSPFVNLWVVNDLNRSFSHAKLKWELIDSKGKIVNNGQRAIEIAENSVHRICKVSRTEGIAKGDLELRVWIEEKNGKTIGQNGLKPENYILDRK